MGKSVILTRTQNKNVAAHGHVNRQVQIYAQFHELQ